MKKYYNEKFIIKIFILIFLWKISIILHCIYIILIKLLSGKK